MQNAIVNERPKFSVAIQSDTYKKLIATTLGDPERAKRFVASISSAVAVNPALQECEAGSILSGALLGEALNLSPSTALSQYYLVPFNNTKKKTKEAQFILGYLGYLQLAIRSGQYKKLNVIEIKEGELIKYDPLNEELEIELLDDDSIRENTKTIGYYAMLELLNGFKKSIYWSREKMEAHALKYSKGYASDLKNGTSYTFWVQNFDGMAKKTMLRQLISKWGVMSLEFQDAYSKDMTVIHENGTYEYVDNPTTKVIEEVQEEEKPKVAKLDDIK